MKSTGAFLAASAALAGVAVAQNTRTPRITVQGNAFFAGDQRFYVRGIDYQPGGSSEAKDPLADTRHCLRDIAKFRELGINTVRIYTVDNTANHDECMRALEEAGIYLALDVNSPKYSLNRADPASSYNDVYLQSVFATMEAFIRYPNLLCFFSANEVINDNQTSNTAPYVKAIGRDMKRYLRSRNHPAIPIGYSAADVDSNRFEMASYMNCGPDHVRSDFFAFNDYSWCDPSNFQRSGWDRKVQQYRDYSIPLFLSEYGCNTNEREFNEVASLYSPEMTGVYSGGLVYEYSEEGSNYGIVRIRGEDVEELDDFRILRDQLARSPPPQGDGGFRRNGQPSRCPVRSPSWEVDGEALPEIPQPAERYMTEGAGPGPGLAGEGSQWHGTPSRSTAVPNSRDAAATAPAAAASSSRAGAASSLRPSEMGATPFMCGFAFIASMLMGAALL